MSAQFELSEHRLNPDALRLRFDDSACGAVVIFEGRVRDRNHDRPVDYLIYEAYAALALAEGGAVVAEMLQTHRLSQVLVVHRTGLVQLGELAVWVGVSAAHRDAAFSACAATISAIKARVPIWKHEYYRDGGPQWLHPLP